MSHADLLIEIGTEELPPTTLRDLHGAFVSGIKAQLTSNGIAFSVSVGKLATPRRLALLLKDVALTQADKTEELHGPLVAMAFDENGQAKPAALGFAKKAGVAVSELEQTEGPKGLRLSLSRDIAGKTTESLLPDLVNKVLASLPIAKRMRWGSLRTEFVRPVQWVLMLHGKQQINATILGVASGNSTRGHRFHANTDLPVHEPSEYIDTLSKNYVLLDYQLRLNTIEQQIQAEAKNNNGVAVIDPKLLEEVTALVEWPVAVTGRFDEAFLGIPSESLISSMREHQKYFHVVDSSGQLLPCFITVANIESSDISQVISGNERVIRARLADAAYFYNSDLNTKFESFRDMLKLIVFQNKLGSVYDKTERVASLASNISDQLGHDAELAQRASLLSKCDLVSKMVLEFSDLQGVMGRYYAVASDEHADVAEAMFEQYLPRFANDQLPKTNAGVAVALADRIDTLCGTFAIGNLPTGSKDPFALRRASLGVLRIMTEHELPLSLRDLIQHSLKQYDFLEVPEQTETMVLEYILDRFSAWFQDLGIATEVFQSVRALGIDSPFDINQRVQAVSAFSQSDSADALASANKRVANILTKNNISTVEPVNPVLFELDQESVLHRAIVAKQQQISALNNDGTQHAKALLCLANLRPEVDAFFDAVMVMSNDPNVRYNRLCLLASLRALFLTVADIALLVR